jgi:four helix bundle protein
MQNPANLQVTGHARSLACYVYQATAGFPSAERFGLTAHMRRAAVSIGSNISEGCGRSGDKEFVHFLHVALGSASELEFQALVATDLGFLSVESSPRMLGEIGRAKRMLARLIKAVRSRPPRKSASS